MFLFGGCTTAWVIGAKLYKQCHDLPVRAVTDQPLFYLSLLAVVLGVQLFLAGFLGELIDRNAADRNKYLIEKHWIINKSCRACDFRQDSKRFA